MKNNSCHTIKWIVRIDRRKADFDAVIQELESLAQSVRDLSLQRISSTDYWNAPDAGAFRDFVAIASIAHPDIKALEYVGEELLEAFGWLVDFQRHD